MDSELVRALRELLDDTQHKSHSCEDERCPVAFARKVLAAHDAREGEQIDPVAHGKEIAARERLQALHRREQAAQTQPQEKP